MHMDWKILSINKKNCSPNDTLNLLCKYGYFLGAAAWTNYASNKLTIVITIKCAVTGHVGAVGAILKPLDARKCS